MLIFERRGRSILKPCPQTLFFFMAWAVFLQYQKHFTSVLCWCHFWHLALQGVVTQQPWNLSPWLFSISPWRHILKWDLGQQSPCTRAVLLKSLVQLGGSGELTPKRPQVPFQGKNQIWFALILLYYAPMNTGLLLFKLPAHQKGWIGAN